MIKITILQFKDDKDLKYMIFDESLQRLQSDGSREEIPACSVTKEKRLERVFYKEPKGKKINVDFSNEGLYCIEHI